MPTPIRWIACNGALGSLLFLLVFALHLASPRLAYSHEEQTQKPRIKTATQRPVILLTGFEPFGEGRPLNPSWEGIKELDGREWRGYLLVSKQLPVVWGEPLALLEEWVAQNHPVAIFSFGQGREGCFALESKASNQRANYEDNRGEIPLHSSIVATGPSVFYASMDCLKLAHALSKKGHPICVSTDAGRYLCEEMLYSLEYIKSVKCPEATVVFCHVPPLGSKLGGKKVTAAHVQHFVETMLDTWDSSIRNDSTSAPTYQTGNRKPEEARHKDMKEIKEFIQSYFRTWSEQDMKAYDECFLPDASIQYIDSRGNLETSARAVFVANQKDYHRRAPHRAVEVPESIDIRFEAKLARAVVYWKLTAGPRLEYGYDHFTLIQHDGHWRIVNLVFYPAAKRIPD